MTERSLLANNLVVAGGTLVSRVTGLVRVAVFAAVVGQTALADAFDVGNNAPNVIYELLIGGALAATLVPLFTTLQRERDADGAGAVFGVSIVALVVVTLVAVFAAPLIFRVYSLDPAGDAKVFHDVGTALTRVFLVQILFYGLNALASAMLNAAGRFAAAAWAPVVSNLVAVVVLLAIGMRESIGEVSLANAGRGSELFWWFSLGPTVGIAAMSAVVLAAGIRAGVVPRPAFRPGHPAVRRVTRLSGWAIGYIATNQVALVVVKNLAQPGSGRLDAYAKAMTIFQLPHGLLAVTIATTFTPILARNVAANETAQFRSSFLRGARLTVLATILPGILLVVFAHQVVRAVLGWGEFDEAAVRATADALTGLAVGLPGFSLYLFALRGFYSHGDTRTPFFVNCLENSLNIALAVLLVDRYGVLGLGLAFAVAYLLSAVVALWALRRRYGTAGLRDLVRIAG